MFFISYRRGDTAQITGRIYDRLEGQFGKNLVFRDLDSIPIGADFRSHIASSFQNCLALVAVIGPEWKGQSSSGQNRIDEPRDLVRVEVGQALKMDIPVIPVLVDSTKMPRSDELPDELNGLAFRNAIRVDSGIDFHHHVSRLCSELGKIVSPRQPLDQQSTESTHQPSAAMPPPFSVKPYLGIMDSIRNIQKALIKEDLLKDYPDGVLGRNTMVALGAFQQHNGLSQDAGAINKETLDTLFNWEARPDSPINQEDPDMMRRYLQKPLYKQLTVQISWLQETLRRSDCYDGPADGALRTDILDAVREFQAKKRADPDGCIGYETLLLAIEDEVNLRDLAFRAGSS